RARRILLCRARLRRGADAQAAGLRRNGFLMQLPRAAFTLARPEKPVVPCMSPRLIAFSIALATAFVAGCDQIPPGPAVSAPPISNATAQEGTSNEDAGQGNGYAFHIRY